MSFAAAVGAAEKRPEQPGLLGGGYTGAVIAHVDDPMLVVVERRDFDGRLAMLDGTQGGTA